MNYLTSEKVTELALFSILQKWLIVELNLPHPGVIMSCLFTLAILLVMRFGVRTVTAMVFTFHCQV